MTLPVRQTENLRHGRLSVAHARYFVTCCVRRPEDRLTSVVSARSLLGALDQQEAQGDFRLLCATLMPDHIHLLLELGERLGLDRAVAKFKAMTRSHLATVGITWQPNFHEHHLRADEAGEGYARYIFLNPYRARLLSRASVWPWWRVGKGVDFDFLTMLEDDLFPPEVWLEDDLSALGLRAEYVGND